MRTKVILFNTKSHDDFIDFIKAYSILCVLFGHTFGPILDYVAYGVWAGMQVPLFILIQSFHCLKKESPKLYFNKVFKRVILPFIFIEIITFFAALLLGKESNLLIDSALKGWGYGPGSYYPWIYFQIAILIPICFLVFKNLSNNWTLFTFLLLSEAFEILFSFLDLSEDIYRLIAFRYLFLIYLGWTWVKQGIRINVLTVFLSLVSLLAIIYFEYFSVDDRPWFVNTEFKFHRWPCYFYVANLLTVLLYFLWQRLKHLDILRKSVKLLATASYEIFLVQMSLIYLSSVEMFSFITTSFLLCYVIYVLFIWVVSIFVGYYFHLLCSRIYKRESSFRT